MQIEVRQAQDHDVLPHGAAMELPAAELEDKRRGGLVTMAWVRGRPVGVLVHTLLWGRVPFMELLWVEDAYRRRGVATAMVTHLEARLRGAGASSVFSSMPGENREAMAWHFEQGFTSVGVVEGIKLGGEDEVFFYKPLAGVVH